MKLAEKDENVKEVLLKAIDDKAFSVQSVALELLYKIDPDFGFEFAKKFENETNNEMVTVIADIFSELGSDKESEFFVRNLNRISGFSKYDFIELYGKFLMGRGDEVINTGVKLLEREARNNNFWFIKLNAINKMTQLADLYEQREKDFKDKADKTAQYKVSVSQKESIRNLISEIKKSENNLNLINIYKN
jgi:aminopeptidase N